MKRVFEHLKSRSHVIWDWNGTLLDDVDLCWEILCETLQHHNFPKVSREEYRGNFSFPVMEYYRGLGFDFDKISFDELSKKFIEKYRAGVTNCKLYPGTRETLKKIKESGLSNSILSAAHEKDLLGLLKYFELDHYFDHVFALDDHYANGKVTRGQMLLKTLAIDPKAAIMIGDTDHDAEVAKELGIDILLFADGHQTYGRLSDAHSLVYESRS